MLDIADESKRVHYVHPVAAAMGPSVSSSANSSKECLSEDITTEKDTAVTSGQPQHLSEEKSVAMDTEKGDPTRATNDADEDDFPEGGWKAYGVLFGCWWMMFFSFGSVSSFGVYQQYYTKTLLTNVTASQVAWIGSLQYFFVFGLGIVGGRVFDRGLMKPVLGAAIALFVFCQLMISLCTQYWQLFLTQGLGMSIAIGFIFQLCISVPSHWFKKRRATAMGILASSAGAGSVVQPIFFRQVLPRLGFAWTMRIIGLSCAVVLTASFFLVHTRLPLNNTSNRSLIDLSPFKMKSFTFFAIGCCLIMFGINVPLIFINVFTSVNKIPGDGYWLSVTNAAGIFGRLIPGFLADRYGKMTTLIPHLCLVSIFTFLFPLFSNTSIVAFALVYGYCQGSFVSLIPVCVNQLGSTRTATSRMGLLYSLLSIGGLFGTPIAGLIMGNGPYHWWACLAYAGTCIVAGLGFILAAYHFAGRELKFRP